MRSNRGSNKKLLPCQLVDPQRGSFTPSGQNSKPKARPR